MLKVKQDNYGEYSYKGNLDPIDWIVSTRRKRNLGKVKMKAGEQEGGACVMHKVFKEHGFV